MEPHSTNTTVPARLGWLAIGLAAVATLGIGTAVAAPGSATVAVPHPAAVELSDPTDPFEACLRSGSLNPDRIVERVDGCSRRTEELYADPSFVDCLRHAAHTADSLEHWRERCRVLTQP
jgi:hypothetical protein